MEKIMNLEKERKQRNISSCLSYANKIKLDINLNNTKFFNKSIKEISKKFFFPMTIELNNEKLIDKIKNEYQHFNIDIENVEDQKLINLIGRVYSKYGPKVNFPKDMSTYITSLVPIKCTISDKSGCSFSFYSLLRGRIGEKADNYIFKCNDDDIKIVDFFYEISKMYLLNEIINYAKKNENIFLSTLDDLHDNSKYNGKYIKYVDEIRHEGVEMFFFIKTIYNFSNAGTAHFINYSKETLGAIFKEMAFDNEDIILQEKQLSEMNSDYARAFEEKKNINKETLDAMKNSLFNKYFKEVEFDNSVNLEKINKLEHQFIDTINFINPDKNLLCFMKKVSLRFRYLGKHKASGLYFPSYKTMCIDLRDPSSFLHEFMHMVDYHSNKLNDYKLSSKYDFRKIVKKYIGLLDREVECLNEDSLIKKQYLGKTKYNRSYYCNSAEIFARCGEIYLNKILKIDNSLIKDVFKERFAYPINKDLDNMIEHFYKQLFLINDEYLVSSATPSSDVKLVESIKIDKSGQISFLI